MRVTTGERDFLIKNFCPTVVVVVVVVVAVLSLLRFG